MGRGTLFLLEQPLIAIAIGRAVYKERHGQHFSQEVLAVRAGVNRNHLSEIENGKHDPQASTILKLARALDLSYVGLAASIDKELAILEEGSDRLD